MSTDLGTSYGRIVIDAKGVITGMQQAGKSIQGFQAGITSAMVGVGAAMAAVAAGVKVAQRAWQTFERGAELDAIENRYERLSASIGSTGDALMARLQEATNGMMTSAQLMESATDIMSLGLGKTEDQTVRLATVVGKLGWDMQQVILTFANNSKMRLDALGLSVEDVTKRAKELEEQGYSTDAAFDLAVIEAGEAKIELLGDASQTTAGKIKAMKTAVKEVQDRFALGVAEGFADGLSQMAGDVTTVAEGLAGVAYGAGLMTRYIPDAAGALERFLGVVAPWVNILKEVGGSAGLIAGSKVLEDIRFEQGVASADRAMTTYAATMADAADESERVGRASLNVGVHLAMAGERFKEATVGGGKFGNQLDALKEKAAQAAQALEATAQRAASYAAAFAAVQGDYTTELPGADEPLVTPERTVSVVTQISGPTEEQRRAVEAYGDELERLKERYFELTSGVGTYGMEQGRLDEAIAQTAGEIAHYEALLAGIPPAVNEVSTSQQGLKVNVDAVRQAIYDQLVAMVEAGEATPEVATAYAAAVGIMTDAQAEAALQAAVVKLKIDELAASIANGMPIDDAMADLDAFIAKMEGVAPAAETAAVDMPLALAPMSEELSTQATSAGEAIPKAVAQGMNDNLNLATAAATEAGTATLDAWNEAVAASDEIGAAIVNGVVAGAESGRAALIAKMQDIARAAYEAAMAALQAKSPSRLFMRAGEAMIDGIVLGLERQRAALQKQLAELGEDMTEARDRITAQLAELADIGLLQGLTRAGGGLLGIGRSVFGLQADRLEADIDRVQAALAGLDTRFDALRPFFDENTLDNLAGMNPQERAYFTRFLRQSSMYGNSAAARAAVEEAIKAADEGVALAAERNRLEEEHIRQQQELAKLEEQRARLDFLQTQVDLLELIRENGLDRSILDGLRLGLDANMTDILAAMTEATRQLVERANEELGIASPSAVFRDIGEQVMAGLAQGLARTQAAQARMRDGLRRLTDVGLADARGLEQRLQAGLNRTLTVNATGLNPAQNVTIYGGYNPQVTGGRMGDPIRELFWKEVAYGR